MADKIYVLPETCGPLLREYYSRLLKEPIPQQLQDLLAMLEEAGASADGGMAPDAQAREEAVPGEPRPDKRE